MARTILQAICIKALAAKKTFIPTPEDRAKALEGLSLGIVAEYVRYSIIDPETKEPITVETFGAAFKKEMERARFVKAMPMISEYYQLVKESTNPRDKKSWISLNCRGMFGSRFKLDRTASPEDQIQQVITAGADGYLGSIEVSHFVEAISKKANIQVNKILDLLEAKAVLTADEIDSLGIRSRAR